MTDFLSPTNARLIRTLLTGPDTWHTQKELASAAGISPPALSLVLRHLQFQEFVKVGSGGVKVRRVPLHSLFVALRRTRLFYRSECWTSEAVGRLGADGKNAVLGLFTAAHLFLSQPVGHRIEIIVPPGKARRYAAKHGDEDGRVKMRIFEDGLASLETHRQGLRVTTSPLQTVLDLQATPGGAKVARILARRTGLTAGIWQ